MTVARPVATTWLCMINQKRALSAFVLASPEKNGPKHGPKKEVLFDVLFG